MLEPTLLMRPFPHRDEGPQGYLLRLAEANLMTHSDLEQLGVAFTLESLREHCLLPDEALDPGLHQQIRQIASLVDKTGRYWNRKRARFCPHCLDESAIWAAAWELIFHDACPRHGVWLVDQCSSCHQPISWDREHLVRCPCGADLRAEPASPCPTSVLQLSAQLAQQLYGPQWTNPLPGIPLLTTLRCTETQQLIRFLGAYMDPHAGSKPMKRQHAGELAESWPITSLAAEILLDWPNAFHAALNQLQDAQGPQKSGLYGFLHHAHYYLYHGLKGSAFNPVRDAFERWLAEHWKNGLSRRNRHLSQALLDSVQWIPGKVATEKLGISAKRLAHLIREGSIDGQLSISQTGRQFTVVRRDQLERLSAQLATEMPLLQASTALGLGKLRMQQLLRLLFPNARRAADNNFMPWCIPRNEVEALLELGRDLPHLGTPDEDQVSLAYVLRYWHWNDEEIVCLIDAVRRDAIQPVAQVDGEAGISRWVFNSGQLRAWHLGLAKENSPWRVFRRRQNISGSNRKLLTGWFGIRCSMPNASPARRGWACGFIAMRSSASGNSSFLEPRSPARSAGRQRRPSYCSQIKESKRSSRTALILADSCFSSEHRL